MAILLCRVDDRLIHGQVVVGWGAQLGLDFISVVDADLAETEWEQELYRAGLPDGVEGRFSDVDDAVDRFPDWLSSRERGFVLTRDLTTMRELAERGVLQGVEVNLGGLHDAPGRRRILSYLFLGAADRAELARLAASGITVTAQDLPGARKVGLAELLSTEAD